jgi:hypothetical protein
MLKIGIILQLFGLSQHVRLLLQYHHVPDRHLQCKIYEKQIIRINFTLNKRHGTIFYLSSGQPSSSSSLGSSQEHF